MISFHQSQENAKKIIVASVSPQSILSLGHRHGLSTEDAARKLSGNRPLSLIIILTQIELILSNQFHLYSGFLKAHGVHYVYDTSVGSEISLRASELEFLERWKRKGEDKTSIPMLASACPGQFYFHLTFIGIARQKSNRVSLKVRSSLKN